MDTLRQDVAHSLRALRRSPGFTITAVLMLALGIGANTAIFTVLYGVLLKPLSYPAPERLVRVTGGATVARSEAIRRARSFSNAASFLGVTESVTLSGSGIDTPEALTGARVSASFLDTLALAPLAGRGFSAEEETPGNNVAMISAELFQQLFHGDSAAVGSTVTLAAAPHTIIGVLPKGFQFPFPGVDLWRPQQSGAMPAQARLNSPVLGVVARLKPGVSVEQAGAEVAVINRQYALANPGKLDANAKQQNERLVPFKEYLVRDVRAILWLLFGAVAFLLIIACANVASLCLARATARGREFAIRAALGGTRLRLVRQLLTESLMLAAAGGVCGLALARWGLAGIARLPGLDLPRSSEIQMDGAIFAFALLASVVATVLFGLAPSLSVSKPDLTVAMKASGESADLAVGGQSLWRRPRGLLVVAQVALSVVLLIGSAVLLQSLARLDRVNPGFQPANLLTMKIALPQSRMEELVQRVESIPGVRSAAVTLTLPLTGWAGTPVQKASEMPLKLNERPIAILQSVSPGYFRTMGIAMRRGRDFAARDTQSTPPVAVITESLAKRFWPSYPAGEDPIGQSIFAGASTAAVEVIGIVGDVRHSGLGEAANDGVYRPRAQMPAFPAMFAVRTTTDPLGLVNAVRREVSAIDPNQTIATIKTMEAVVEESEGRRRSIVVLLQLFAVTGLALAMVGIYGVIAYSVALRTREVGIRRALGAQPDQVVLLVLRQGLSLALPGVALGILGAVALSRVLQGLVFEVSPTDPPTYGAVALALLLAATAASYIPARRAARIGPSVALRG